MRLVAVKRKRGRPSANVPLLAGWSPLMEGVGVFYFLPVSAGNDLSFSQIYSFQAPS
jgi:hypothetical protein